MNDLHTKTKTAVFVIQGNGVGMADFLTMEDGMDFVNRYSGIKNLIIDIPEAWQQKDEPIETFKDAILVQWIPLTNNFIQRWGMAMVPYDVRWVIADIRRNVGLHPLTWPTILLITWMERLPQAMTSMILDVFLHSSCN